MRIITPTEIDCVAWQDHLSYSHRDEDPRIAEGL